MTTATPEPERIGRFLLAEELPSAAGAKTRLWRIVNTRGHDLGGVKWSGAWRCYVFQPGELTDFHDGCLVDIAKFLRRVTNEVRATWRRGSATDGGDDRG